MFGSQEYIQMRTLGAAAVSIGGRKLKLQWPSCEVRKLFYSLLTPLDEFVEWERLDRAVPGDNPGDSGACRVRATYRQLRELFIREAGRSPFREYSQGVGLDYGVVRLDAREFRECSVNGLNLLATGDHEAARNLIEGALALYAGPFLLGKTGRIVNSTREVLAELYGMINQDPWKSGPVADRFQLRDRSRFPEPAIIVKCHGQLLCAGFGV
jgi:Bacterial transcriptional activator domain